jgi:hypothetical protein
MRNLPSFAVNVPRVVLTRITCTPVIGAPDTASTTLPLIADVSCAPALADIAARTTADAISESVVQTNRFFFMPPPLIPEGLNTGAGRFVRRPKDSVVSAARRRGESTSFSLFDR